MQLVLGNRFTRELRRLSKKYSSILDDIDELGTSLLLNPRQGVSLGQGCYKIRLAITSKRRGKSGSARVITHVAIVEDRIVFLSIFDKSEESTLSKEEILGYLKEEGLR
jgi:mRNA-degrading endonuclease RelE of RelBE toxin-antitoxin system